MLGDGFHKQARIIAGKEADSSFGLAGVKSGIHIQFYGLSIRMSPRYSVAVFATSIQVKLSWKFLALKKEHVSL